MLGDSIVNQGLGGGGDFRRRYQLILDYGGG